MTRILHVITGLGGGGAEAMLYKLTSGMDSKKFKSVVVSLSDKGDLGPKIEAAGVPVYVLGMKPGRPSLSAFFKLYRLIKKFRPHILQSWLYHADLTALLVGKLARVPKIFWNLRCSLVDFNCYGLSTRLTVRVLARLSPFVDGMIYNSEAGRKDHEAMGFRPAKWEWIPNGFDLETFRPNPNARAGLLEELDIQEPAFLIGHIARYDPMKDHVGLIKVARNIVKEFPQVRFILAGSGVHPSNLELNGLLKEAGLSSNFYLLGKKNDVAKTLQSLDALVLCSAFGEGFPNILGEAMACGVPCIATDVGDSKKLIGASGFIVPPKNPGQLAAAICKLAGMASEERAALGKSAREIIAENYSLPKIVAQYERFYGNSTTDQ